MAVFPECRQVSDRKGVFARMSACRFLDKGWNKAVRGQLRTLDLVTSQGDLTEDLGTTSQRRLEVPRRPQCRLLQKDGARRGRHSCPRQCPNTHREAGSRAFLTWAPGSTSTATLELSLVVGWAPSWMYLALGLA